MPVQTRSQSLKAKLAGKEEVVPKEDIIKIPKLEDITTITFNGRVFSTEVLLNNDMREESVLLEVFLELNRRLSSVIYGFEWNPERVPITDNNYKMGGYFINDRLPKKVAEQLIKKLLNN